jgi:hypothetical protein
MEILTAYVRKNSNVKTVPNNNVPHIAIDTQAEESTKKEVIELGNYFDIQAIMTVISRRKYSSAIDKDYFLDLRRIYLREADLEGARREGANLEGADLIKAKLGGANLES